MEGCPITMPHMMEMEYRRGGRPPRPKCGLPLAPGAKFCEKHEADRIRLLEKYGEKK